MGVGPARRNSLPSKNLRQLVVSPYFSMVYAIHPKMLKLQGKSACI
jgi:hypothetical protein